MRPLTVVLAFVAATVLGVGVVVTVTNGDGVQSGYRVDVLFDTAKGLLPGQLVKVAGARSGEIVDVTLTDDFKARVQLRVDPRFGPFTQDARCTIQPEGLIGENFVQCDPGSRDKPELRGGAGGEGVPTVPVERTTVPVSFPELFDLATVPVRQRLTIVLNELGIASAARGEDINAILRRANPTLGLVRQLGKILDGQRVQLGRAAESTDTLLARLAPSRERAGALIGSAGNVTAKVASRRADLEAGLRKLPTLLRGTRGTVQRLGAVLRDGTPVLEDLEQAAPGVERVVDEAVPFSRAAGPALRDLGSIARQTRGTLTRASSTVKLLKTFSGPAVPAGRMLAALLLDLRDRGVIEGLLDGFRLNAQTTARFDKRSHFLPLKVMLGTCSTFAKTAPTQGCEAHFTPQATTPSRRRNRRPAARRPAADAPAAPPDAPSAAPSRPSAPATPKLPPVPAAPATGIDALDDIVDGLLKPGGGGGPAVPKRPKTDAITGLLDYLLR